MTQHDSFAEITHDTMATVTGGAGFLDGAYKSIVFHFASNIGGTKLAQKMYGAHVTAADQSRAQAAFKQFLVAGDKLPKGVPNLF